MLVPEPPARDERAHRRSIDHLGAVPLTQDAVTPPVDEPLAPEPARIPRRGIPVGIDPNRQSGRIARIRRAVGSERGRTSSKSSIVVGDGDRADVERIRALAGRVLIGHRVRPVTVCRVVAAVAPTATARPTANPQRTTRDANTPGDLFRGTNMILHPLRGSPGAASLRTVDPVGTSGISSADHARISGSSEPPSGFYACLLERAGVVSSGVAR